MLSRLGEGALETLQTTRDIAKQCLNRALGYTNKATEEKVPEKAPDKATNEEKTEQMLFKRDVTYEEELGTADDDDDEDLVLITHQPCRVEIEKKKPLQQPDGVQEKFRGLGLGEGRFEEVSLE